MPQSANIEYNGEKVSIAALAQMHGISKVTLRKRLRTNPNAPVEALLGPGQRKSSGGIAIGNISHTVAEWAEIRGIRRGTIIERRRRGWTWRQALEFDRRDILPPVQWVLDEIDRQDLRYDDFEARTGLGDGVVRRWSRGTPPNLSSLVFAIWSLGYDIKLRYNERVRDPSDLVTWMFDRSEGRRLGLRELSRISSVALGSLSCWRSGKKQPSLESFMACLKAMRVKFPTIVPK